MIQFLKISSDTYTMKYLIVFTLFLSQLCIASSKTTTVAPNKKTITILKAKFVQKEEKQNASQYLSEYLPAGEDFENYTQMFAVWGLLDGSTIESQVKAKVEFVNSRKPADPVANYTLFKSDENGYGLDFLISEGPITEHNIWYYIKVKGGVLAYQYNRRHYKGQKVSSAKEFIEQIPKTRNQILEVLKSKNMPIPSGYKK